MKEIKSLSVLVLFSVLCSAQVNVSKDAMNRNVLLEEFTGMHCEWSPSGADSADKLVNAHPGRVYIISYHSSFYANPGAYSDFTTDFGSALFALSNHPTSWTIPSANINREMNAYVNHATYTAVDYRKWHLVIPPILDSLSPVNMAAECFYHEGDDTLNIDLSLYFTDNYSGKLYLHIAIVQDNIWEYQKAGFSYPARYDFTNSVYRHMNVFRENLLLDDSNPFTGMMLSSTNKGDQLDFSFKHKLTKVGPDIEVDMENTRIVAYLTTDSMMSGTVITTTMQSALSRPVGLNQVNGARSFIKVYPNPVIDKACIELRLEKAGSVSIELVDVQGKTVHRENKGWLNAGSNLTEIPVAQLDAGIYFLRVNTGDEILVRKVLVNK